MPLNRWTVQSLDGSDVTPESFNITALAKDSWYYQRIPRGMLFLIQVVQLPSFWMQQQHSRVEIAFFGQFVEAHCSHDNVQKVISRVK
jgi:hypothetical protein